MQLDLSFSGPITVSELTRRIREKLESGFSDVWITGEISGLRIPPSGHIYFTLKDKDAQIKAVFFRSGNRYLKFAPRDGMEVILRGRVTVYDPRGEYQVVAEYMEPKGIGALQLAFLQLKEKLEKEGLFDQVPETPPARPPEARRSRNVPVRRGDTGYIKCPRQARARRENINRSGDGARRVRAGGDSIRDIGTK